MKTQTLNLENLFKKALFAAFVTLLLIYCCGMNDANAQIVLDNSYKPAIGDDYVTVSADTAGIFEGIPGPGQTWDFSNISLLNDPVTVVTGDPAFGSGSSNFPGASLVTVVENAYTYVKAEGNSYFTMGVFTQDAIRKYTDMQKLMEYPFSFSSSFADDYKCYTTLQDGEIRSNGNVTVTADAWGTLVLPSGTYSNALRIKTVINNTDSILFGGGFVFGSTNTTYSWYVSGTKVPVFSISYFVGDFGDLKSVSYVTQSSTGIEHHSGIADGYTLEQNFPNPFNPSTTIDFSISRQGFTSLKVYDMLGKEVAVLVNGNLGAGAYSATFDAAALPSGVYFYKLETEGFTSVKKMTLIK